MPTPEKLEAELRARDEFFSAVAHELRNPLNALHLTVAGLLRAQSGNTPLGPDQMAARLNRASGQIARLAKLVDDMLDVSRISAGRFNLQVEDFDAVPVLRDAVERLKDPSTPIPISLRAPDALSIRCDKARLAQIVTNLLANAVAYGNQKPVEVRLEPREAAFRIAVIDHGIGIATADQERIFERFAKLGAEAPNVRFGVGLWIAREVARALGGDITVKSKPGAGATFIVELPRHSNLPAPAAPR